MDGGRCKEMLEFVTDCESEQKRMERTNRTKRRSEAEGGGRKAGEAEGDTGSRRRQGN